MLMTDVRNHFDILSGQIPSFSFESNQLEILSSPDAFYYAIEDGTRTAHFRIIIATLYLGTGELEKRLVETIVANANKPRITLLADATRSTRPIKLTEKFADTQACEVEDSPCSTTQYSSLFLLQSIAQLPFSQVALYQSHLLRGWIRRILPVRLNEIVGLQHMKILVFDNNVVISGANLSEEYFKTRQDRAWLFRDVPSLAEFYSDLVGVVASLSYQLTPEGELKAFSKEADPRLANKKVYCDLFRSRIEAFLSKAKTKYVAESSQGAINSVVFPVVQMGSYGLRQETTLVQQILGHLPTCSIDFTTGYFCPTNELQTAIIDAANCSTHPVSQIRILCAAPEVNSFFNSQGLSGSIPAAYREMLIAFFHLVAQLPNVRVHEYLRPGWTFHAKGLWVDTHDTTLTLIGSSNYGYRSRDLDLESQLVVVTRDTRVRQLIKCERDRLWDPRYLRAATLRSLTLPTEPRFRWYTRWALPLLRRIM